MQSEMLISAVVTFGAAFATTMSLLAAQRRIAAQKAAAQKVALQQARVDAQQRRRNTGANR